MSEYLVVTGGAIFLGLGLVHAILTAGDMRRPRWLAAMDPELTARMASIGLRLARGRTSMWDAWLGFNLSHALGAVLFGALCVGIGLASRTVKVPKAALGLTFLIGALYFGMALRFWFRAPAIAIGAGTACLLMGWLLS